MRWLIVLVVSSACTERAHSQPLPALTAKKLISRLSSHDTGTKLELRLDPNIVVHVKQNKHVRIDDSNFSWFGTTGEQDNGYLAVSVNKGHVYGTLLENNRSYQIVDVSNNGLKVKEIRPADPLARLHPPEETMVHGPKLNSNKSPKFPISVLVAYTIKARNATNPGTTEPSCPSIEASIVHAIDITNQAFAMSSLAASVKLAGEAYEISFDEREYGLSDIVKLLANKDDPDLGGPIDKERKKRKADVVILVAHPVGSAFDGLSRQTTASPPTAFSVGTAFSVVRCEKIGTNYYALTHELGHLLGLNDDHDGEVTYDDGYGYADKQHRWRTLMTGPDACGENGCTLLPYWSDPHVNHPTDNVPLGDNSRYNSAHVINQTANAISRFN